MIHYAGLRGDSARLSLKQLFAHPRLPSARNAFIRAFLELYDDDPQIAHLLIEFGRFLVFYSALANFSAQDSKKPETWATVGRLKRRLQSFNATSVRQVDKLISDLRDAGFLEVVKPEQDGRLRIIKPTQQAMAHDREWLCAHYVPLAILFPDRDYSLVTSRDAAFQLIHRRRSLEFVPIATGLLSMPPEVMVFFRRPGGYMFLATLLAAAKDGQAGRHATVSYAEIGERFGYSRTHVRQVLTDAENAGLVRLHSRGGHDVEILQALWAGHDKGVAAGMCLHDMIYTRAAADWRAGHEKGARFN